jgi:DNA-binding HxlR family transcriptional regulator
MIRKNLKAVANDSITYSAQIVGDTWNVLIIKELLKKNNLRFNEIFSLLEEVSPRTLSQRLTQLQTHNIISKNASEDSKFHSVYGLTKTGQEIAPIIKAMDKFGTMAMKVAVSA